jgi:hypothetical protein
MSAFSLAVVSLFYDMGKGGMAPFPFSRDYQCCDPKGRGRSDPVTVVMFALPDSLL